MSQFIVRDTDRGNERPVESRAKAEEVKQDLEELGADVEIIPPNTGENQTASADGGAEVVEHPKDESPTENIEPDTRQTEAIPEPSNLTSDPLDVISKNAKQFTESIRGKTVINRQGYAVLAERFNISVEAEPVTLPSETDFEYAEFRAVATTEDGQTYTGFGSAHVDRQDGDDPYLLAELAETRAMKRCTAWATGVGMTAVSELKNEL